MENLNKPKLCFSSSLLYSLKALLGKLINYTRNLLAHKKQMKTHFHHFAFTFIGHPPHSFMEATLKPQILLKVINDVVAIGQKHHWADIAVIVAAIQSSEYYPSWAQL